MCSTVLRRRKLVHYNSSQVEGNRCYTAHVFRRGLVLNCSRDKGVRAVMYSKEQKWCCTKFTGAQLAISSSEI